MNEIKSYVTADGTTFTSEVEAHQHEMNVKATAILEAVGLDAKVLEHQDVVAEALKVANTKRKGRKLGSKNTAKTAKDNPAVEAETV